MRKQQRRDSAHGWIASGAEVTVKAYAKRFGVDRYTAHDDLTALGFPLTEKDAQWSVRPPNVPKRPRPEQSEPAREDGLFQWVHVGHQRMFVVDYTSGGAPIGYVEGADCCAVADEERTQLRGAVYRADGAEIVALIRRGTCSTATTPCS
ncbi:hypothetical protein [Pseudonocardia nigra]|uniref:hypothetical protein n=1 Tax=Pseudonocardia nigra TaxID=1921578 RepID=UPI001C5E172E|nr:hypothetical protein [Pseudonocardia nigra]